MQELGALQGKAAALGMGTAGEEGVGAPLGMERLGVYMPRPGLPTQGVKRTAKRETLREAILLEERTICFEIVLINKTFLMAIKKDYPLYEVHLQSHSDDFPNTFQKPGV